MDEGRLTAWGFEFQNRRTERRARRTALPTMANLESSRQQKRLFVGWLARLLFN